MTIFGSNTNVTRQVLQERCVDYQYPGLEVRNKAFELHKTEIIGSVQSGKSNYFVYLNEYPSVLSMGSFTYPWVEFTRSPDMVYSQMVKATAPNRPDFSVPTFLAEGLKEFPDTIKRGFQFAKYLMTNQQWIANQHTGRWTRSKKITPMALLKHFNLHRGKGIVLSRNLGAASLAIQFGFQPFVSDILSAANVISSIERRRKEVRKLREEGNLARRWDIEDIEGPVTVINTQLAPHVGKNSDVTIQSIAKSWATVRWYSTPNSSLPKSDHELVAQMLGLTVPNALLAGWEAMPWSWMIDYFTNVGDVLAATANGIQYNVQGCVMQYSELRVSHSGIVRVEEPAYACSLSRGTLLRSKKQRFVYAGMPGLSVRGDLLSPKQMSILVSLAAVKGLS